jgi:site-specific DNA-methyltransferase (adenine-specific)
VTEPSGGAAKRARKATRTSAFGVGRRESHDASDFYARFAAPELSKDTTVNPCPVADSLFVGDSREMAEVPDKSVALVVTSPPYFAGKEYEAALGTGSIPADYVEFLAMLRDVFAECRRVLEPGGRICVNVANLGRKPYRSLSADVIRILQDDLGLLLRGEVVWIKGKGAAGSTAWGSFLKASSPAFRDVTERIVIAGNGRLERARTWQQRKAEGLPWESTIAKEDFMAWTLDTWQFPTASAKRVGHPAPFPVELPRRCIELYTYLGDVVLDPFMGAGTTAEAAVRAGRRYVGFDTDPAYVELAGERVARVREELGLS